MAKKKNPPRPRKEPRITGGEGDIRETLEEFDEPAPQKRKKKPSKSKVKGFRKWLVAKTLKWGTIAGVVFGIYVYYLYSTLPDITTLADVKKTPSIIIKSEDGKVVGTYGDIYGNYIPYSRLPVNLINAVVATEDRNFFHHHGIDPWGLLRAGVTDIRAHHLVQGGSTITQQVAKNIFLSPERTLKRKIQEVLLALELERRYSKQEILTIYLNRVYMGAGNYGVDSASKRYFGHSVVNTTLSEDAMLVGLLKAPSRYAPTNNADLSEARATQVLLNMKAAGYLTDAQVGAAEESYGDEDSSYRDNHNFGAFYFSDYVLSLLPQDLINMKEDLVITTTLNVKWQQEAEDAVNAIMDKNGKAKKASQAALLAITPDGGIRAMVGGRNYRASQFNRVTQGLRQPGSSFKLFVYLAALENGYLPDSQMVDQPINVGKWHPRDYTGKYMGPVTLRTAFSESLNSVAVQLSEAIGRDKVIEMARRLGITTPMEADPSIALGTNEVTLYDMTKAYAQVATDGVSVQPYAITHIETADGRKLFERVSPTTVEVLRDSTVKMMNDLLIAVTEEGTGKGARFGRPIAGKTGTTSDYKDAWFIGFTPQLITGVWVGNDDTTPMKKVSGGSLPASIWRAYMAAATRDLPVASIPSQSGPGLLQSILPSLFSSPEPVPQNGAPPQAPVVMAPLPGFQPQQGQAPAMAAPPPGQPQQVPQITPAPSQEQPVDAGAPEDQPVPEYNAPASFWDKLMGDDKDTGQ